MKYIKLRKSSKIIEEITKTTVSNQSHNRTYLISIPLKFYIHSLSHENGY
jgi:hypothetical protein